jgi:hypothetical protein
MLIKEAGTYRGVIVDHAVSASSGGFPQWTPALQATEKYDFETNTWVNWTGREDCEITGFLTLFSKKGDATFHVPDIMKITDWDGRSLVALNGKDLTNAGIQFSCAEDTYEGVTRMKLVKIAEFDAVPSTGSIRKLSNEDLATLDNQFAAMLKKNAGPAKPSSPAAASKPGVVTQNKRVVAAPAASAPSVPAAPTMTQEEFEEGLDTAGEDSDPALAAAAAENPALSAPAAAPAAAKTAKGKKPGPMTKEVAWSTCVNMAAKDVNIKELTNSWMIAVKAVGIPEAQFTKANWAAVCETVCNEHAVF